MSFAQYLFVTFASLFMLSFGIDALALYASSLTIHWFFLLFGIVCIVGGVNGIMALIRYSR
jgi:hypothetical protein